MFIVVKFQTIEEHAKLYSLTISEQIEILRKFERNMEEKEK
jgi:hypothetical protein